MELPLGIYEQIINEAISKSLNSMKSDQILITDENLEYSDSSEFLSRYLQQILRKGLNIVKEDAKKRSTGSEHQKEKNALYEEIEACNTLIAKLSEITNDKEILDWKIGEEGKKLLSIYKLQSKNKTIRPRSSISISELFTGGKKDIALYDELCREIASSNEVLFIVSFIKISGLNLILDALKDFTQSGGKLKIITTTYMGATEPYAIKKLSELQNTEIKISYNTKSTRLHAKSYIFKRNNGFSTIFIGSSNLSKAAVSEGMEWNIKLTNQDAPQVLNSAVAAFEAYWYSPDFELYSEQDSERLEKAVYNEKNAKGITPASIYEWYPLPFQEQILEELKAEREVHNCYRNLVVAATGTGKTVISGFDYRRFVRENPQSINRLLYIANRKEILNKSMETFRSILKDYNFGELYTGEHRPKGLDHIFMTIDTFNSQRFETMVECDFYDYIIVDEVHHGAAASYQALFNHFKPKILLGLTATPERMDEKDILHYFDNRVATEIRLPEAISRELLVPFQYYGITDETNGSSVRFVRGKFNGTDLNNLYVGNRRRAALIVDALNRYRPYLDQIKGLGFCVSQEHAKFMSHFFNECGIKSVYLTGNSSSAERNEAPQQLMKGEIKLIFTVDIYNEGVDIPDVNTILLLRPTESLTVFIQQLGRGLRKCDGKTELIVLDFIGQFDQKYRMYEKKIRYLTSLDNASVRTQLDAGFSGLPPGCSIKLEEKAKEIIYASIKTGSLKLDMLKNEFLEYKADHGSEPTLEQFLHEFDHSLIDIYRLKTTFTKLRKIANKDSVDDEKDKLFVKGFGKLRNINSNEWIYRLSKILNGEITEFDGLDKQYLLMTYYSFFDEPIANNGFTSLSDFVNFLKSDKLYSDELYSILKYNSESIKFVEKDPELKYECALKIYCSYYTDQIFAGLGKNTESYRLPIREGVYYYEDKKTDVLLVNLNKSDKDFSPTTMYEDYAINDKLFHWQSQSRTSDTSTTGRRYVEHDKNGSDVLLFVRENKYKNNMTEPYMFLGKGHFVSCEGSKPMSIVWEMENKMPTQITSYSPVRG